MVLKTPFTSEAPKPASMQYKFQNTEFIPSYPSSKVEVNSNKRTSQDFADNLLGGGCTVIQGEEMIGNDSPPEITFNGTRCKSYT